MPNGKKKSTAKRKRLSPSVPIFNPQTARATDPAPKSRAKPKPKATNPSKPKGRTGTGVKNIGLLSPEQIFKMGRPTTRRKR